MDTIEQAEAPKPAAKRTRKKAKAKRASPVRKVVQIAKVQEDAELGGLTSSECPYDCTAENCVISGINVCGHPNKGAPKMQADPGAMERYNRARKILAHQALDRKP